MTNCWLPAQCSERTNAADAKDDFLLDPILFVAAVELGRDRPILGTVAIDVGIEEIERYPLDLDAPHPGEHFAARHRDGNHERRAILFRLRNEWQIGEVVFWIA